MAFQTLSLGAAISASALTFPMTAVSGAVVLPAVGATPSGMGVPILLDTEFMYVVSQPSAGVYTVRGRGSEGTAAAPHDVLTNVYASVSNDFGNPQPGTVVTIDPAEDYAVTIGQDQTLALGGSNTVFNINKATAAAIVLPAPNVSDNGVSLVFTSLTAAAHVITATSLLRDGTSGSPKTTATFAAFPGATMTVVAENGFWNVPALQNVVLS